MKRHQIVVVALLLLAPLAYSQAIVPARRGFYRGYDWGYSYPWGVGGTTADESRARGMAELIRAQADAAKTREEVHALEEKNKLQRAQIRQEKRNLYEARQAQEQAEREQRIARRQQREASQSAAVARVTLTPDQLDPVTGEINWPAALQTNAFQRYRDGLEQEFARRASAGGLLNSQDAAEIRTSIANMESELKKQITTHPTGEYLLARNFLKGLKESV